MAHSLDRVVDSSDRTLIWGGARVFVMREKVREVLSTYLALTIALAIPLGAIVFLLVNGTGAEDGFFLSLGVVLPLAVVLSVLTAVLTPWYVGRSIRAEPPSERERVRLESLVTSLGVQAGISSVELRVFDSDTINAISVARPSKALLLIVTRGAVERLPLVQLEVVVARELARARSGLSRYDGFLIGPRQILSALTFAKFPSKLSVSQGEEVARVDLAGLFLTKYPPSLCEVLIRIHDEQRKIEGRDGGSKALARLWLNPLLPIGGRGTLSDRIADLKEW